MGFFMGDFFLKVLGTLDCCLSVQSIWAGLERTCDCQLNQKFIKKIIGIYFLFFVKSNGFVEKQGGKLVSFNYQKIIIYNIHRHLFICVRL